MANQDPLLASNLWLVWKSAGNNAQLIYSSGTPRGYAHAVQVGTAGQHLSDISSNVLNALIGAPSQFGQPSSLPNPWKMSLPVSDTGIGGTLDNVFGAVPKLIQDAGDAINSTVDFLKLIAWLFHPRNMIRAVEFLVGIALMFFGLHAAIQSRGERMEGFVTSEGALTRSGIGRVAAELGAAARRREAPRRPASAPHATRRKALRQRYSREEDLQRRRAKSPRPKKAKPKRKSVRQPAYT